MPTRVAETARGADAGTGFQDPRFIPPGQYFIPQACRIGLSGLVHAPITALWNLRQA